MSNVRLRATNTSINRLRNIGPTSNAPVKFIVDSTPFNDDDDDDRPPSKEGDWIIEGRLLPQSEIYRNGAIRMNFTIPTTFPFKPPTAILKTPVFHPNVTEKGEVCIDLLKQDGTWTAATTLDAVVIEVTKVIDNPRIDHIQHTEAAHLYDRNKEEYNRKASEIFNKNCAPRN